MIKEITVATRTGGSGDVDSNARLRKAVTDAKAQNMPNDTIDRAIKRGMGEARGRAITTRSRTKAMAPAASRSWSKQ